MTSPLRYLDNGTLHFAKYKFNNIGVSSEKLNKPKFWKKIQITGSAKANEREPKTCLG